MSDSRKSISTSQLVSHLIPFDSGMSGDVNPYQLLDLVVFDAVLSGLMSPAIRFLSKL